MVSFVIDTVKVGDTVEIQYDPKDPSGTAFTQGLIFGCIAITVGGILVPLIVGTILTKKTEGFYRIFTKEKNLDLLFVTFMASALSGATDVSGGSRKIMFSST